MNIQSAKEKIAKLIDEINSHNYKYYVLDEPSISDFEYDMLLKELEVLEQQFPELIIPESPTQRVGKDLTKDFQQVKHRYPMLSLANTYNEEELYDFDRRVRELLGVDEVEYVVELKIDGVSISLIYKNGKFVTAATRGDGETGEEVTNNIKTIKSIPLSIPKNRLEKHNLNSFEVRGEVFMEIKEFETLNEERMLQGEKLFANPRNFASGTIKLQDPATVAKRKLSIFTYYLLGEEVSFDNHYDCLQTMRELGFKINPLSAKCTNISEAINCCRSFEEKRATLPYEIDGAVIKVNSLAFQKRLGSIAKSPRWATSFKFKAKQATTKLEQITWQVGRTGAVTPVAELTPTLLAGSTISRATLHNIDEIQRKDIRVGDTVFIEKGGDVIPKVVSVVIEKRPENSEPTIPPERCPVCAEKLVRLEDEAAIYCENANCPAQIKGKLIHFASRGAMDIEGLGEAIIEQLADRGYLKTFSDIYKLNQHREELVNLERFGSKSIDNLLASIEKSKSQPFAKVLFALGVRFVGIGAAKKITEKYNTIESLITATKEEISSIHEIGESISQSVTAFLSEKKNLEILAELKEFGLNFECEAKAPLKDNFFLNKTFVLTGTLEKFSREEAAELISKFGGKPSSSVSKKTNYILAGENAGSKLVKAKELNIEILTEQDFIKLIAENEA